MPSPAIDSALAATIVNPFAYAAGDGVDAALRAIRADTTVGVARHGGTPVIAQLPFAGRPILALVYGAGDQPDPLLAALADRLQGLGMRLAGLVQRNGEAPAGNRCNMLVELLPGGLQLPISENRGAGARGCRLDHGLLVEALAAAETGLDASTDLLILNRFGKVEAEGGGGRALIVRAVDLGVPVLLAVPWRNIAAFRAFAGDLAAEIGLADFAARLEEAARIQPSDCDKTLQPGSIA